MISRRFGFLLVLPTLLVAQKVPLATFTGTVRSVSKKTITIENQEGNLVDFEITGKTRTLRGKQQIHVEDLKTGDQVTIEARQEVRQLGQYLVAVVITAIPPP